MLRGIAVRLRALVQRRSAEAELDEELRYHLDREIERLEASGLSPADARRESARAFGNVGIIKEEVRDSWGARWLEHLSHDTRFALRGFRRSPGFALTVVTTIALALGLNTSVFTIFDAYVLRPIAVRDAASLYQVFFDARSGGRRLTLHEYDDLRTSGISAESYAFAPAFARVNAMPLFGNLVTGNALQMLGARPAVGRLLLPEDAARPFGQPVIVLGYDAWQSKFGGDSAIVGSRVEMRGLPLTVVGVAARGFTGIGAIPLDFWAPITLSGSFSETLRSLQSAPAADPPVNVVIRLGPGTGPRRAANQLAVWSARETASQPDSLRLTHASIESLASALPLNGETIAIFAPAVIAFGLVLLIACANVANVMLARGLARQREIGIRLALGAARGRLVKLLLTESALLAVPAAALGYVLSRATIDVCVRILFASAPGEYAQYLRIVPLTPDPLVFAFVLAVSVLAALLFGLVPAIQATRPDVVQASRGDFDGGLRSGRARGMLVVTQIVVCSLLLIVTGVLLRGAAKAGRLPTGMHTANVVQIDLQDTHRASALQALHRERVAVDFGASVQAPLDGSYPEFGVRAAGGRHVVPTGYNFVDDGFFRVLGITLVSGRPFTADEERTGAPVAIISQAAARTLWPDGRALGRYVQLDAEPPRDSRLARVRTARVIGVCANAVSGWLGTGLDRPVAYYPLSADSAGGRMLARVTGDAHQAGFTIDRDLSASVPGAVVELHSMDEYLAVQRWPYQVFSWVSTAIGTIALILTLVGVYGVLSYLVAQRTREIGVRMALGASVAGVVTLVLRQSARYAIVGVGIGIVLALGVSKLFASALYVVDTFDFVGYASGAAVVIAACLAAAWAPSRRAARVDPLEALRTQ